WPPPASPRPGTRPTTRMRRARMRRAPRAPRSSLVAFALTGRRRGRGLRAALRRDPRGELRTRVAELPRRRSQPLREHAEEAPKELHRDVVVLAHEVEE